MADIKNNPKVGKEKNFFVMTGTIPYAPTRLTTSAKKLPFVSFLLEQVREAGADYKEYKRYFQILVFDEKTVDFLTTLDRQVKVEVTGNITIQAKLQGKYRVSLNKLIALKVEVTEQLEEGFRAKKSEAVANKTEEEHQVLDKPFVAKPYVKPVAKNVPVLESDDDLPF
jgi:ribosomal protein S10